MQQLASVMIVFMIIYIYIYIYYYYFSIGVYFELLWVVASARYFPKSWFRFSDLILMLTSLLPSAVTLC
jgi:hypothetical protein